MDKSKIMNFKDLKEKTSNWFQETETEVVKEQIAETKKEIHKVNSSKPITITTDDISNTIDSKLRLKETLLKSQVYVTKPQTNQKTDELVTKANRLEALGFSTTKEQKIVSKVTDKIDAHNKALKAEKAFYELKEKYAELYPGYKFVTDEIMNKVREQYSIIKGLPNQFNSSIPEKNLSDIETFQNKHGSLTEEKWKVIVTRRTYSPSTMYDSFGSHRIESQDEDKFFETQEEAIKFIDSVSSKGRAHSRYGSSTYTSNPVKVNKSKLVITAPAEKFDLKNYSIDHETNTIVNKTTVYEIEDPIVSLKVPEGEIIITAWDKEADIPQINF